MTEKRWPLALAGILAFATSVAAQSTPPTFGGMTPVASSSAPVVVTLTAQSSGTLTSLVAVTGGSPNLDFAVTPVTCVINMTLNPGDHCTVSVVFSPQYPSVRQGAVVATAGSQLLAGAPVSGIGLGSLPVLVPGTIKTVAGNGDWIYQRDGIAAIAAAIFLPTGLAVDAAGNLYIADTGNNVVRRVDAISGVITTYAGQMGTMGYAGDGSAAASALLTAPRGLALTPGGDLVITDSGNNAIRQVNITSNQIQTIAGTGVAGYNGDSINATLAELNDPYGVAVRSDGAIAIADLENQRVRLIDSSGVISTVLGTGQRNAGTPTQEQLNGPADVAFDPAGDLFVADAGNNRVRVVAATGGTIQTLTGTASEQFAGDGGPANLASVYGPYALAFDAHGDLWLSDTFHNRVREITGSLLSLTYATIKVGNVSPPIVESLANEGNADLILSTPVLTQAALDSGTTSCSAAAMAPTTSCNMGIEFAPTMVGANITGSIRWPSNAAHVTPLDSLTGTVLSVDVTSTALTSSKNPGVVGQSLTLTATVSSANGSRIGTVTFSEGSSTWCGAVTLNSGGTANCVIPGLALGSHSFTASYSGDANDAPSTSPAFTELIKQQPALVLSVAPRPAVVSSNVTLSLTAVDQSGTPTGSIVFDDGAATLATVALDGSGNAQWSTQAFSVGNHSLSAHYAGDSANSSGTSNTVSETITAATTATALALSASSAGVGTALIFTATVTNNNGPPLTGSVTFKDGTTVLGAQPLSAGSSALTVSTLAPGSHSITAAYSGDSDNGASTSPLMTETIAQVATVAALGSDANVLNAGATLHLTTSVSLAPGGIADGALTGNVTFQDGSTVLGVVSINAGGQANLAVSVLSVGSHSLTASFAGNTNYAPSNSPVVGLTVQQTITQTTLSSTSSTTLAGKPAGFSVTVTSATGIPTGQVSLRDSSTVIGTATLSLTGSAAFSTSALSHGTHSITAVYGGDSNYLTSISAVAQQTVQLAQPSVTLSGPVTAVDAGTSAAFTAALTTPGVTPTGTVALLDGSSTIATATVSGDGSYVFTTAALSIGNHTITASYSGDGNNSGAVSQAATVVIRAASSTTSLITSVDPLIQGNALILTATVISDSPNAGGQMRFLDGPTLLGTIALGPGGTASLSATGLAAGTHALTAVYSGDTNHAGSTSASTTELVLASASATLSSSNNPAVSGQNVTFTVQLGGAGKAFPTGTATLSDNGVLLAAFPLNNTASGSFSTRALMVGSHTVTLSYGGDQNFAAAAAQLVQTVVDATTQTTLAAPANPSTYAQPVSLVATVTSIGGAATGTVNFSDAGANIGAAQLNASGVAVLTLSTLAPGAHGVVAQYAGDGKAAPSASTRVTFSVKQTTALAVSANSDPGFTLSPISFTASVTNAGAAPATGTINFTAGGNAIGTAPLDGTGRSTLTLPAMSAGSYAVAASYAGDGANLPGASAVFNETIQLRPSSTTVTGSTTNPANLQQITLIAVVAGQGNVMPGGTVTFTSGSTALGQASLGPTGVAIITAIFTQPNQPVTASYAGDLNYAASQSTGPVSVTGVASPPQFTLSVSAPSITLVTRQHTTINVLIASVKGFSDTIALGCSGLPKAATCTFTPSQVALSANGTPTVSVTVDTGDPLGAGSSTTASLVYGHGTLLCCLPLGLLAGLLRRRAALRNLGVFCLCAAALALTISVSGCSGLTIGSTAPGTYNFDVVGTAAASGLTQTQTITLVVTQ